MKSASIKKFSMPAKGYTPALRLAKALHLYGVVPGNPKDRPFLDELVHHSFHVGQGHLQHRISARHTPQRALADTAALMSPMHREEAKRIFPGGATGGERCHHSLEHWEYSDNTYSHNHPSSVRSANGFTKVLADGINPTPGHGWLHENHSSVRNRSVI